MAQSPTHDFGYEQPMDRFCAGHGLTRRDLLRLFGAAAGAAALGGLDLGPAAALEHREPLGAFQPKYPNRQSSGTVTVMQGVDANTLDPALRNSTPEFNINCHIYDTFTWRDPKTLQTVPNIVREWRSIDPTTWELRLVQGAKFHDGSPVTSEAARFSLDRVAKTRIGNANVVQSFARLVNYDSTEIVDDLTFRIKTKEPSAIVPDLLAAVEIVPPKYFEDESDDNLARVATTPLGSGPYRFKEWVKNDRVVLEANPDYWNGKPPFETVIFKPVPELSTRLLALQNGQADIIVNVAPDQADAVNKDGKARVSSVTGGRIIFVGIRNDKLFSDKRARQALNISVNFDAINRALLNGAATRAKAPGVNPPNQNPALEPFPYNIDRAKQLLQDANFPLDATIPMQAPSGRYVKDKEIAQALAQNWQRQLGLKIDLKVLDWTLYAGTILPSREPDDLYFLGLGAPFTGQEELFYFDRNYSLNYTRWENQEYFEKFDELKRTIDPAKRTELMYRLQEILWDECPWVFVYHQVDFYGVSNRLDWEARPDERIWLFDARFKS